MFNVENSEIKVGDKATGAYIKELYTGNKRMAKNTFFQIKSLDNLYDLSIEEIENLNYLGVVTLDAPDKNIKQKRAIRYLVYTKDSNIYSTSYYAINDMIQYQSKWYKDIMTYLVFYLSVESILKKHELFCPINIDNSHASYGAYITMSWNNLKLSNFIDFFIGYNRELSNNIFTRISGFSGIKSVITTFLENPTNYADKILESRYFGNVINKPTSADVGSAFYGYLDFLSKVLRGDYFEKDFGTSEINSDVLSSIFKTYNTFQQRDEIFSKLFNSLPQLFVGA